MAMICPQCSRSFEQQLECPTCGVRLQFQTRSARSDEGQWQQTPWGRIIVGLLLAQGLGHGLHLLVTAGRQVSEEGANQAFWTTVGGIILFQGLQGISLLIAGAITGAGWQRGILFGSFVGLVSGLAFLLMQLGRGEPLTEVALFGQPILHLAFGATGGLIGTLIWKPLPAVRLQPLPSAPAKVVVPSAGALLRGPIAWIRVVAGVVLVVMGVIWSQKILLWILAVSEGQLAISSHMQGRLVTWEISAIATLIGAGFAGATTANGLKQGLLVGLGSVVLLAGILLGNPKVTLNSPAFLMGSILFLTAVGGWFGGQLFPPISNTRRSRSAAANY